MTRKQALRDAEKARDVYYGKAETLQYSNMHGLAQWYLGAANAINWLMEREEKRKDEHDEKEREKGHDANGKVEG